MYQKGLALRVVLEEVAARATERRAAGKEEAPAPTSAQAPWLCLGPRRVMAQEPSRNRALMLAVVLAGVREVASILGRQAHAPSDEL